MKNQINKTNKDKSSFSIISEVITILLIASLMTALLTGCQVIKKDKPVGREEFITTMTSHGFEILPEDNPLWGVVHYSSVVNEDDVREGTCAQRNVDENQYAEYELFEFKEEADAQAFFNEQYKSLSKGGIVYTNDVSIKIDPKDSHESYWREHDYYDDTRLAYCIARIGSSVVYCSYSQFFDETETDDLEGIFQELGYYWPEE